MGCPCCAAPAGLLLLCYPSLAIAGITQGYVVPFSCFDQSALHVSLDLGKYIGMELVTQVHPGSLYQYIGTRLLPMSFAKRLLSFGTNA